MTVPPARETGMPWPSPALAWWGVVVLMLASVFSLIDRQVLSLLVDPMKASLGLSDVQIATLQGPAFMVSYTLLGFPLGWLADRVHRIRLVAVGIVVWSVACAACGLMESFESLAIARMFVGVGEAVLAPATLSLVADYFAPARRPLAMSVVTSASTMGIGLAMLAGGSVIALARASPEFSVAGLPPLETWRWVFIACGVPGVLVAMLLLTVQEPARREDRRPNAATTSLSTFLRQGWRWVSLHFAAISVIAIIAYGFMAWSPSFLVRRYGWSITEAAFTLGLLFVVLGPAGSIVAGWLTRRRRVRGEVDAPLRVCRLSTAGLAVGIGALALEPTAWVLFLLLALAVFSIAMAPGISAAALQEATPNALRGRMAAIYYIVTNLLGASLGPVVAALLTQQVFVEPAEVGFSLATVALLGAPLAAVLLTMAFGPYRAIVGGEGPGSSPSLG